MEGVQILKFCPTISDIVNPREYFAKYHEVLDKLNSQRPHNMETSSVRSVQNLFFLSEENDRASSRNLRHSSTDGMSRPVSAELEDLDNGVTIGKKSKIDAGNGAKDDDGCEEPFSMKRMDNRCLVNQLTVEDELEPRDLPVSSGQGNLGRITNWFAGSFMDGVIPEGAQKSLSTLAYQAKELYQRETVKDYIRLRNRSFKYSTTVRTFIRDEEVDPISHTNLTMAKCTSREVLFNIRIQRPYHKRTFHRRGWNPYPNYSEEYLVAGSQLLTQLKDLIICLNNAYCHKDVSSDPDMERLKTQPTMEDQYPSGFFYINGVFYVDRRHPFSKDMSAKLRTWIKKTPNYNPVTVEDMNATKFIDLNFRIGYPYVYQHLGNCEHLITITDVRLHHRSDIQDMSRYPLLRGNPIKVSIKCIACNHHVAVWVVKDNPKLPSPNCHFCDRCMKMYLYDGDKKIGDFKVYPFMDEVLARKRQMEKEQVQMPSGITVTIGSYNDQGQPSFQEPEPPKKRSKKSL